MPAARCTATLALLAFLSPGVVIAADPEATPAGALSCSGCHPSGPTIDTPVPRLTGRAPAELAAAMRAFRGGARPATVMDRIAKGFTDPEIEAIAAWFGAQKERQ
ncbi:MAG: cytochrome C [Alphaproteobacteria bacterium]|nr:cytochrome C [Alphaproteobacteria bacterium]